MIYRVLRLAALIAMLGLFLAFPAESARQFSAALRLLGRQVLPALFPFFVLCPLLLAEPGCAVLAAGLRPVTRLCGVRSRTAPLILLLGVLGGYAVFAQSLSHALREHRLSAREAQLLLVLGTCSSPGFVVGAVGGLMLGSTALGWVLWAGQLWAGLCCALFWRALGHLCGPAGSAAPAADETQNEIAPEGRTGGMWDAVRAGLTVSGCVLFFRTLCGLLFALMPLPAPLRCALAALLEVSTGCAEAAGLPLRRAALGWACAALSLLGVSVLAQLAGLLDGFSPLGPLLLTRPLHLGLSELWLAAALRLWPGMAAVYSSLSPRLILLSRARPDAVLLLFLFCCAALHGLRQRFPSKAARPKNQTQ